MAWRGVAGLGTARQGISCAPRVSPQKNAKKRGGAWLGAAWRGLAGLGKARYFYDKQGNNKRI